MEFFESKKTPPLDFFQKKHSNLGTRHKWKRKNPINVFAESYLGAIAQLYWKDKLNGIDGSCRRSILWYIEKKTSDKTRKREQREELTGQNYLVQNVNKVLLLCTVNTAKGRYVLHIFTLLRGGMYWVYILDDQEIYFWPHFSTSP